MVFFCTDFTSFDGGSLHCGIRVTETSHLQTDAGHAEDAPHLRLWLFLLLGLHCGHLGLLVEDGPRERGPGAAERSLLAQAAAAAGRAEQPAAPRRHAGRGGHVVGAEHRLPASAWLVLRNKREQFRDKTIRTWQIYSVSALVWHTDSVCSLVLTFTDYRRERV